MMHLVFKASQYRKQKAEICLEVIGFDKEDVLVESFETGVVKRFNYDAQLSEEKYINAEGWDGEEHHAFYRCEDMPEVTLNLWCSPYGG